MIRGIKFVGVPVTDQDKALKFWTEAIGMKVTTDQPFNEKQRWIELKIPGADTGIAPFTPDGHANRIGQFSSISFRCDDSLLDRRRHEEKRRRLRQRAEKRAVGFLCGLQRPRRQPLRSIQQIGEGIGLFPKGS